MASSVLASSTEKTYGFKLMRLIADGGTEQLRNVFSKKCPGNLQTVLATHYHTLYHLFKTKKVITQPQWDKLYPHHSAIPNIKEFDITLLVILLRNICGLSPPATGWNVMPSSIDNSLEADIVRIRLFRNNFFGHVPGTDITKLDFEAHWVEVASTLRRLGLNQAEIDELKDEKCGEEEVKRVRKEWNESDKEVVLKLNRVEKKVESIEKLTKTIDASLKQDKCSTQNILAECLYQHDFKEEIESFYHNYTPGTREWVFEQVSKWLKDKLSDNRAFIISGQAGMGKSTIAAVTCKRFTEHFGACHFFQYNNSRYNNPKFLLQSLAWQLCHVIPEYKQNLTINLSGNKARLLDDQNIEGMFSMLFKEPFSNIADPGKHFLIVIDALDECRQEEKQTLVDLITHHFYKFPRFIRFLVTTRSETNIARKFQELKPVFLQPDDKRNLNDLRLFFENKLKTKLEKVPRGQLVEKLVEKSDGLMLYASFLCKLSENGLVISENEDLPLGIEEIYDRYFKRLEGDLRKLGVDEKQFLKFLSVIAVSKRPLPLTLLERLFRTGKNLSIASRTLGRLIGCLSSLLVIKDGSLLFFHKSVRDWLVKPNHDFTISERYGHKALADICVFQMQTLKKNEVSLAFDLALVYALQYGIQHIIEARTKDIHCVTKLLNLVIDLEIVHASVCIDIYLTLSNLFSLESYNMQNSLVCWETQNTITTLISIIRKSTYILKDVPQSFLQHVVNENEGELSSKASALLMTRYRGLAYFESEEEKKNAEKALIGRTFTENDILEIDISPSEDFLICRYKEALELFSLPGFKPLWMIENYFVQRIPFNGRFIQYHCTVFHPFENFIFPGQLTPVVNFEGKFESGPIMCRGIPSKFTTSCFSHDRTKMVTNYGIHLTVWNLHENRKIVSLSCRSELYSVLFSANDRFIATTNVYGLCVYDSQNSYSMVSMSCRVVLFSTYYLDSWFVLNNKKIEIVKHDLTIKRVTKHFTMDTQIYPANARAVAEFQAAMESNDDSCFHNLGLIGGRAIFFILTDESVLVYRKFAREIKLVGLTELIQDSNNENPQNKCFSSLRSAQRFSLSVDGRYVYANSISTRSFSIVKLSCPRSFKSVFLKERSASFVPVTDGVFVLGEEFKSSEDCLYPAVPELWNFEMTQCLASFPELIDTYDCVSVTQDLVACIMQSEVCFFNVLIKAIVARIPFPKHIFSLYKLKKMKVIACSSLYYVLMRGTESAYLLQSANGAVDLNSRVFDHIVPNVVNFITSACFSPNGQSLALCLTSGYGEEMLYILDINAKLSVRGKFSCSSRKVESKLEFVDGEHLLCDGFNDCLCLINVDTCNILSCIDLGHDHLWAYFACRNAIGIIAYSREYGKFKQIKLWLPQQRKNKNEQIECYCWIHGRNENEPTKFPVECAGNMSEPATFSTEPSNCSIM